MLLPRTTADQMRVSGTKADDRSGASAAGAPTARSSLRRTYLFSALWLALCWILYSAFTGDMAQNGTCGCEMAYMWPSYRLIEWEGSAREQYAVHLYREGHTDPAGAPSGVPVLFLPGNAGAYQQGRSVAASAATLFYRPSQNPIGAGASWRRPLDFFVFDFNEEFSALHAPTLDAQADFVAAAVPHILESYAGSEKPTRILLLGHSMGGIVARLAAQRMDNSSIDAIVTMSTPHDMPPVALDAEMDALYTRLNSASYANPSPPLVSLCGGVADTQIVSDNCALPASLAGPEDGFAVFSTAVPGVWTGVEHQVMVWCDQVRWRVARALLDMADARARSARLVAARKWLLPHSEATHSTDAIIDAHHDVTVTSERMTLLVHLVQPTPAALVDPPVRVQHCEGDTCSPAKWIACAVPRTRDAAAPFPFPGEGVTAADSMLVVDVTDIPVRGHLRVELPANSKVAAGGFESFDGIHGSWGMCCQYRDCTSADCQTLLDTTSHTSS